MKGSSKVFLKDVIDLRNFAKKFAKTLKAPQTIALHGDLGVGKTEFARAIIKEFFGKDTTVPSPTFTIVQEYGIISHFDLYRIKNISELEEIGFNDAIYKNIVLVEWPEKAEYFMPENAIHIYLSIKDDGREIEIKNN